MKKFNILRLLSVVTLAAAGVFGTLSMKEGNKVESIEAASVPSGVYVDISGCQWNSWGATLANIKAHFFKGGTGYTTWPGTSVTSVSVNGKTYGYASVPSGATQVIFNAWGGEKNQDKTGDLTIPTDGKLLFKVTSYNTGSVQTGSWSNLDSIHPTSSLLTPSNSTSRVFINNDSAHADWKSAQLGIRAWGGSCSTLNGNPITASVYCVTWFDGNYSGVYYAYADIPVDCTAFQVVRLSGDTASSDVWSYSDSVDKSNTCFTNIYYLVGGSTDSMSLSGGGAKDDHAGNILLEKLLEAYDTCDSSDYNGYGQAGLLSTNFYSHADDWAKNQTAISRNGSSATIRVHFEAMLARASGGGRSLSQSLFALNNMKMNVTVVLVVVSFVSVGTICGYFFIRKRKENN